MCCTPRESSARTRPAEAESDSLPAYDRLHLSKRLGKNRRLRFVDEIIGQTIAIDDPVLDVVRKARRDLHLSPSLRLHLDVIHDLPVAIALLALPHSSSVARIALVVSRSMAERALRAISADDPHAASAAPRTALASRSVADSALHMSAPKAFRTALPVLGVRHAHLLRFVCKQPRSDDRDVPRLRDRAVLRTIDLIIRL